MYKKIKLSITAMLLSSSLMAIEIHSGAEAVNIVGKQRMYTQRLLKDYAMVGMNNTYDNPSADLKKTIDDFSDHLSSLEAYAKDGATKEALKKVDALWSKTKTALEVKPDLASVGKLQEDLDALLKASDEATKSFAKASGEKKGEVVNIAGRQRMLSQRMASLYMLKVWGVSDPKFKAKLTDTMTLFKDSLKKLEDSPLTNDEIQGLLKKVKRSFMFFEMMNRSSSKFVPTLIYKKSNEMLENMDKVTQLYVKRDAK